MAKRPVFLPNPQATEEVTKLMIEFEWVKGQDELTKKQNVQNLHQSAKKQGLTNLLEVSTKSPDFIGYSLSAFNLTLPNTDICVESLYQSAKVFEQGGPYKDLLQQPGYIAKTDNRLKQSGKLTGFLFKGRQWDATPITAFYDWIYLNVLIRSPKFSQSVLKYDGFTDIEFNPSTALNCQARTVAYYLQLQQSGLLAEALKSPEDFLKYYPEQPLVAEQQADLF